MEWKRFLYAIQHKQDTELNYTSPTEVNSASPSYHLASINYVSKSIWGIESFFIGQCFGPTLESDSYYGQ